MCPGQPLSSSQHCSLGSKLRDLLDDPMTRLVMESDGVPEAELSDLIARARRNLIAAHWRGQQHHETVAIPR